MRIMIFRAVTFRYFDWGDVLFLSLLGFLLGLATKLDLRGRYFAVAAAQHPEAFRPMRLPLLPIALLGALSFPVIELLTRWNTEFRAQHAMYVICMAGSAVSVSAWLVTASRLLSADDRQENHEIMEFLSHPDRPVPAPRPQCQTSPWWLRLWNGLNVAAFIVLMLFATREFSHHSMGR
jgi:hypothetical protein